MANLEENKKNETADISQNTAQLLAIKAASGLFLAHSHNNKNNNNNIMIEHVRYAVQIASEDWVIASSNGLKEFIESQDGQNIPKETREALLNNKELLNRAVNSLTTLPVDMNSQSPEFGTQSIS